MMEKHHFSGTPLEVTSEHNLEASGILNSSFTSGISCFSKGQEDFFETNY